MSRSRYNKHLSSWRTVPRKVRQAWKQQRRAQLRAQLRKAPDNATKTERERDSYDVWHWF